MVNCDFGHIVFTDKIPFTGIIYLQPGTYKMEFRFENTKETTKTIERKFAISSGITTNLKLN